MSDKHPPGIGITGEIPSIAVRAVIELSGSKGRAYCFFASRSMSAYSAFEDCSPTPCSAWPAGSASTLIAAILTTA
jgi:hypothetical protein